MLKVKQIVVSLLIGLAVYFGLFVSASSVKAAADDDCITITKGQVVTEVSDYNPAQKYCFLVLEQGVVVAKISVENWVTVTSEWVHDPDAINAERAAMSDEETFHHGLVKGCAYRNVKKADKALIQDMVENGWQSNNDGSCFGTVDREYPLTPEMMLNLGFTPISKQMYYTLQQIRAMEAQQSR